jgi:hypothetical protein
MVNTWLGGPRIFYTWNTEESWEVWLSAFHRSTDYKLDATVCVFKKKKEVRHFDSISCAPIHPDWLHAY